jgi:hypothetical protein
MRSDNVLGSHGFDAIGGTGRRNVLSTLRDRTTARWTIASSTLCDPSSTLSDCDDEHPMESPQSRMRFLP